MLQIMHSNKITEEVKEESLCHLTSLSYLIESVISGNELNSVLNGGGELHLRNVLYFLL